MQGEIIAACQQILLDTVCPGCYPGLSGFCDFSMDQFTFTFFPCCNIYAPTGGPPAVTQCDCERCVCCPVSSRDGKRATGDGVVYAIARRRA